MKLNLVLSSLLFVSSVGIAADVSVNGGATTRTAINSTAATSADNLVFDSTSGNLYSGVSNFTVKSVTNTTGNGVSIALPNPEQIGLTVDVNAASGNVTAVDVLSWSMNYCSMVIKNSASVSTANTSMNFGTALNLFSDSPAVQYQNMTFDNISGTLTASKVQVGSDKSGDNKSTMTINSNSSIAILGAFVVAQSGVLNVKGTLTLNPPNTYTFKVGSVFNITGNFVSQSGSFIALNGTTNTTKALSLAKFSTSGKFTQTADSGITFTRESMFESGADWTILDKLTLSGYDNSGYRTAELTMNEGANLIIKMPKSGTNRIIFNGYNNLILKGGEISGASGEDIPLVTMKGSNNNLISLNADSQFSRLFVNDAKMAIKLLDDTSVLRFTDAVGTLTFAESGELTILNFREKSIYVGNDASIVSAINENVIAYDSFDNLLGTVSVSDGWLSVVPEPAEYAAIFGIVVLAFATYRRRK